MDVVFSLVKIFREKRAIRTGRQKFFGEFFPRTEVGVVDLDHAVVLFAEMKRILSCKLKNYAVSSAATLISKLEGVHTILHLCDLNYAWVLIINAVFEQKSSSIG